MPLAVGSIVLVTYKGTYAAQRYMLTHTYRVSNSTSTGNTTDDTGLIALYFSNTGANDFATRYRLCLATNYTINEIVAQPIYPQRLVRQSISVVYSGTGGTDADTGNICGVVTLRTQFAGRSQVANKHVGPIPKTGFTSGQVSGTLPTSLFNFLNSLRAIQNVPADGANSIELTPVIWHKGITQHDVITTGVVSDRVGTMRRRTLRVGE